MRRPRELPEYHVRVFFDERSAGLVSGPFQSPGAAEDCANAFAARADVLRVVIETSEDE